MVTDHGRCKFSQFFFHLEEPSMSFFPSLFCPTSPPKSSLCLTESISIDLKENFVYKYWKLSSVFSQNESIVLCLTGLTLACGYKSSSRLIKGYCICATFLDCLFIQYMGLALPVFHMQMLVVFVKNNVISANVFLPSSKCSQHKKQ